MENKAKKSPIYGVLRPFSVEYRPYVSHINMVPVAQLAEHLTVDQIAEENSINYHPINAGWIRRKTTTDPIYGVGLFMLKQTCAPFVRHFMPTRIQLVNNWQLEKRII